MLKFIDISNNPMIYNLKTYNKMVKSEMKISKIENIR